MKRILVACLLLMACKPLADAGEKKMTKPEVLALVEGELSSIKSFTKLDCSKDRYKSEEYACFGVKADDDTVEYEVHQKLKGHLNLLSAWVHEYTTSAKYLDDAESIQVGFVYTPSDRKLGTQNIAPGYQGLLRVFVEDNPYR